MGAEYDYIYTFTSKLLHATPASVSTSQKILDEAEMRVLLRYILVRIKDVLAICEEIVESLDLDLGAA